MQKERRDRHIGGYVCETGGDIPARQAEITREPFSDPCHFLAGLCQKQDLYMGVHV